MQAILSKYNVPHEKDIYAELQEGKEKEKEAAFRPWIEGVMEKLMPDRNILGNKKYKTRLFRLFDEALVWFAEPSFFSKLFGKKTDKIKPLGVLPLALVASIRTCAMDKMDDATEEELLTLELQIGKEGCFVLKCSDFNQRIKWLECLHVAVFNVERPLSTKVKCLLLFLSIAKL